MLVVPMRHFSCFLSYVLFCNSGFIHCCIPIVHNLNNQLSYRQIRLLDIYLAEGF